MDNILRHAIGGLVDGMTDVGADDYSGEFWVKSRREELQLLRRVVIESHASGRDSFKTVAVEARQLPDGSIMVIRNGLSWTRWTSDPDIVAERKARQRIVGHRYDRPLLTALIALEREGMCPGMASTWFGGTYGLRSIEITGMTRSFSGMLTATAPEKLDRLRTYLSACIERGHGVEHASAALDLARDGSITEVVEG